MLCLSVHLWVVEIVICAAGTLPKRLNVEYDGWETLLMVSEKSC